MIIGVFYFLRELFIIYKKNNNITCQDVSEF